MKQLLCLAAVLGVVSTVSGRAVQEAPSSSATFGVASIKPGDPASRGGGIRRLPGGRVNVINMTARSIITYAYQLNSFEFIGGPAWLDTDRFDISAKLEGNPGIVLPGQGKLDPLQLALRALLVERFHLRLHTESRETDAYALVMLKPGTLGPALKRSSSDCKAMAEQARQGTLPRPATSSPGGTFPCNMAGSIGVIRFDGFDMALAARTLSNFAGRPVVDRTGLSGNWQFVLTFLADSRGQAGSADAESRAIAAGSPDPDAPSLFTAVQEQLGLKLQPTKAPVDVMVVDQIEHPTLD